MSHRHMLGNRNGNVGNMDKKEDKFIKMIEERMIIKNLLRVLVIGLSIHIVTLLSALAEMSGELQYTEIIMYILLTGLLSYLLINISKL